jgi:hypothetical protein
MATERTFSFAEIVEGHDALVSVTDDGMLHAVNLVMVMSGKDRNNAGRDLRDLPDEIFQSTKFVDRQLSSRGGHKTKLISFQNAIELIMVLPGKTAKATRSKFADIIRRYLAGDSSLIIEINANAASDSPIAQLARADSDAVTRKRQLERDDALFDMEMAERKQRLMHMVMETNFKAAEAQVKTAEAQAKVLDVQKLLMDTYTSLCPNRQIDDRARLMFKDNFLNIASQGSPARCLAVENGIGAGAGAVCRPFSVSDVALALRLSFNRGDTQKIGKLVAAAYREKYGQGPSKHEQWVDGACREVCSYTEKDRGMVEEVIKSYARA